MLLSTLLNYQHQNTYNEKSLMTKVIIQKYDSFPELHVEHLLDI